MGSSTDQSNGEKDKQCCSLGEQNCKAEVSKDDPANESTKKHEPRLYQEELHKAALRENVIIFLGTGLGKTFISVLYLNSPQVTEAIKNGRKVVFLAPSRDLLKQQAEYIEDKVSHRVKAYCGGKMAHGSSASWRKELANVDVLFMMPDIFVFAISTNLVDWREMNALVLDECHHAYNAKDRGLANGDGSAYRSILLHHRDYFAGKPKDDYLYPRPRLIGLTASLINSMPKSDDSVADMVSQLERLFQGRCVTDLRVHESRPTVITYGYTPFVYTVNNDTLTMILHSMKNDIEKAIKKLTTSRKNASSQTRNARPDANCELGMAIKVENYPKIITHLIQIRERCGIWALETICARLIHDLDQQSKLRDDSLDYLKGIYSIFYQIILTIQQSLKSLLRPLTAEESLLQFSSAKPLCLLDILEQEYENARSCTIKKGAFSCVVFIRSRLEVLAIQSWLDQVSRVVPRYKFIKCGYALGLAGTPTTKCTIAKRNASEQARMLEDLRAGRLNVVVTTAVLEEGIDLPNCSAVTRYDLPDNFREYVQSRGRARQEISRFVVMCEESERTKVEGKLRDLNRLENDLKHYISGRHLKRQYLAEIRSPNQPQNRGSLEEVDIHYARANAVRIGPKVTSQILNHYCQSSKAHSSGFKYITKEPQPGIFRTTIEMPSGCMLKASIEGAPKTTKDNAENSAATRVLKALINGKQLNDNGTPYSGAVEENLEESLTKNYASMFQGDHMSISKANQSVSGGQGGDLNAYTGVGAQSGSMSSQSHSTSLDFLRKSSTFKNPELNKSVQIREESEFLKARLERIRMQMF